MDAQRQQLGPDAVEPRWPIARAGGLALEFIGLYWLTEPLFARFGFGAGDASRGHLLFVGAFFGIGLSVFPRRRRGRQSRP